jgi:hypothetical protein
MPFFDLFSIFRRRDFVKIHFLYLHSAYRLRSPKSTKRKKA